MYANIKVPMITSEGLMESMGRIGVDVAMLAGIGWEIQELERESNHYISESVHKYPDRLIGFCSVNPR